MLIPFMLIAAAVTTAAAILLTKLGFARWFVIGLAAVIITFGVTPATFTIGENIARDAASTYNEYYDGYELAATTDVTTCYRDGACVNTYNCDTYYTTEVYTDTDSKGNTVTKTRQVEHHHSCPESTQETSYYVNTTIGSMTIGDHLMTGHQWRFDAFRYQHETTPAFWLAAKARIDDKQPGPVTSVHTYQNFILASQTNLFKKYSGTINTLVKKNLLPAPASGVVNYYHANKAYFLGNLPANLNRTRLTNDVAYLGAATGLKLQGDVHVVFVNAAQAPAPTDYLNSLMAYWQSDAFGKNDISKNTIVVAVGVSADPTTGKPVASWVRAATGMPIGNEAMLIDIRNNLENQPVDSNFIGRPMMDPATQVLTHTTGLLESTIFGTHQFQRVSMSDNSKGDKGLGYKYLQQSIPVPTAAYVVIAIIILLLAAGFILLSCYLSAMMSNSSSSRYTSRRY